MGLLLGDWLGVSLPASVYMVQYTYQPNTITK